MFYALRVGLSFFKFSFGSVFALFWSISILSVFLGVSGPYSGVLESFKPPEFSIHSLRLALVPLSAPQQLEGGAGGGAAALSKFIE